MLWNTFTESLRLLTSCMSPVEACQHNTALAQVLDEEEHPLVQGGGQNGHTENGLQQHAASLEQTAYDEHVARTRVEGELEDCTRRLAVAQEQVAEYAHERSTEAQQLLDRATQLHGLIGQTNGQAAPHQLSQALLTHLQDMVADTSAFAKQQRADADRSKRSYSQARLAEEPRDVDMKRMREDTSDSEEAANSRQEMDNDRSEDTSPSVSPRLDSAASTGPGSYAERAKYIPLRLSQEERRLLRLLEAALSVSEYTDKVDVMSWTGKQSRVHAQLKDICAILSGLLVAQDYKRGQRLLVDRNFKDNAEFFQDVFEVGRRYKIMNPDRMRSDYGKLMYLLMDASEPAIQELLEFNCVRPLRTVAALLQEKGGSALLTDPLLPLATAEIKADGRARHQIQGDIKRKEKARDVLCKRYASRQLSAEEVHLCIVSLADNNTFLAFNRDPVDAMIRYLTQSFHPSEAPAGGGLAISGGLGGARLTHNHSRQFAYVLQSLTLWREIMHDMFQLWCLAEKDLLDGENRYRLVNTGQGMNRVQAADSVGRAMRGILSRCQQRIGGWVGSSVIHLGDHNVPNALLFIDKYTQVPRILNPVVLVLEALPDLCKDPRINNLVTDSYGGVDECRHAILTDLFRHAFDGGGADNFFDAGSCIDGRLTSAWNWGSKLEKKTYAPIFKLAGFTSFDGEFVK